MDEWISAREVELAFREVTDLHGARLLAFKRAHAGLIDTRAHRLVFGEQSFDDVMIPLGFWWGEGNRWLEQVWGAGDFTTFVSRYLCKFDVNGLPTHLGIDEDYRGDTRVQAFGVRFRREHVAILNPNVSMMQEMANDDDSDRSDSRPVSDSALTTFYDGLQKANAGQVLSQQAVAEAAKAYFIGRSVSRERIRALKETWPIGRPKVAENSTAT